MSKKKFIQNFSKFAKILRERTKGGKSIADETGFLNLKEVVNRSHLSPMKTRKEKLDSILDIVKKRSSANDDKVSELKNLAGKISKSNLKLDVVHEATNFKSKRRVKFVRVKGRIIPIKAKK